MAPSSLQQPLLPTHRGVRHAGPSTLSLGISMAFYLGSGISQPLLMSAVRFAGMADTSCQIYMLPYYIGQACTGLLVIFDCPSIQRWKSWPLQRCMYIALLSAVSQNLNYAGNMLAGSSVFAVIYSSVTVWCAVLSRVLLQRVMTTYQWLAVMTVFLGLVLTGMDARSDGGQVWIGACMVFLGAVGHAFTHVLSELISVRGEKIPPQINSCVQGLTAVAVVAGWQVVYTLPHWGEKIGDPMAAAGTSAWRAAMLLIGLALGNLVHAAAFFHLLAHIGATSAGVVKAVQAVAVFGMSHTLYCGQDPSQCLTASKTASLIVVVSGVVAYVHFTAKAKSAKAQT